ncbi:MAG: hypothetical protein R3B93_20510 [Bacteroidia bacterium]
MIVEVLWCGLLISMATKFYLEMKVVKACADGNKIVEARYLYLNIGAKTLLPAIQLPSSSSC